MTVCDERGGEGGKEEGRERERERGREGSWREMLVLSALFCCCFCCSSCTMISSSSSFSSSFSSSSCFWRFYYPTDPVSPQGAHTDPRRQIWKNPRNGWCHGGMPCLQVGCRWRQRYGGKSSGVLRGSVSIRIGEARPSGVWARCTLRV